jgi:hypothetical protein
VTRAAVLKVAMLSATTTFACLKIKPFEKQDGGSDILDDGWLHDTATDSGSQVAPEVRFTSDNNGGGSVIGPDFFVRFGSGGVAHYPDRIQINGVEMIGHEASVPCNAEDETGIALFPAERAAVQGATPVSNNLIPHLVGPAVVKLEVFSVLSISGSNSGGTSVTRMPTLRSRYTFHPDGKTFRYDTIEGGAGDDITTASMNCTGSTTTQFTPTSFTTLRNAGTATLYRGASDLVTPIPSGGTQVMNPSSACIDYGQQQIAFGWNDTQTRIRAPSTSTVAFVYDFDPGAGAAMGSADYWTRSAMFLGRGNSCTAAGGVHDQIKKWQDTNELLVNSVSMGIAHDGIYGGEGDPGSTPGIATPPSGLTVIGTVPTPFAMWINYAPGTNGLTITKSPAPNPPFYQVQNVGGAGHDWLIWFRDPITSGQTITITPQ